MKLFSGSSNPELAKKIASYMETDLGEVDITRFPDGEVFVQIQENIRGKDVFIIQSICNPANEHLMEMLIMIDAARRASAARITAVIPFYGYARQDRKHAPRVPITAKLVANLLVAAGANRLLGVDFHAQQIQGFFDIPVDHLYAAPVMVKYLREQGISDPVVVSPDAGGVKMAGGYAQMLDAGLALGAKYRKGASEVKAMNVVGDVAGKTAIMVDDMVSTAGTLTEAAKILKKQGAENIIAVVTHQMIGDLAIERLTNSPIKELIVSDSIPLEIETDVKVTVLSIADLLGEAITRIHDNQSVTSLFRELEGKETK